MVLLRHDCILTSATIATNATNSAALFMLIYKYYMKEIGEKRSF